METSSEIANFYANQTVLIIGGSGFVGKVLIEKLLYSCPDIKNICLLIRDKDGKNPEKRLELLTESPVFSRLKSERPDALRKLVAFPGDVFEDRLGLSNNDYQTLQREVTIVFHLAAVVKFDEKLADVFHWNVNATNELVKMCKGIENLKAFVYVSTAFSNADRSHVEEIVYPSAHAFESIKEVLKVFPDDEYIARKLLGNKPNTYTYTKSIAEDVVGKASGQIPVAIVRPSIVISSMKEPFPGFVDAWHGSAGLILGVAFGLMKVVYGKGSNVTDLIPVDTVINVVIAAATKCERSKSVKVYNCCSQNSNPLTQDGLKHIIMKMSWKHGTNKTISNFVSIITNRFLYKLLNFVMQIIPSFILDLLLRLRGKPARYMKLQSKVSTITSSFSYFLLNQWKFADENVRSLHRTMSPVDRKIFNVDIMKINWESCIENYILGGKKYLIKSD